MPKLPVDQDEARIVRVEWDDPKGVALRKALNGLSGRYADREADPDHLPKGMFVSKESVVLSPSHSGESSLSAMFWSGA